MANYIPQLLTSERNEYDLMFLRNSRIHIAYSDALDCLIICQSRQQSVKVFLTPTPWP